jgi:nuclear transport factor 2 (NTF2) superfamily protein
MTTRRPPLPPFTPETAVEKVRLAEDGWNNGDPEKVTLAYTIDSYSKRCRIRAGLRTRRSPLGGGACLSTNLGRT